MLGMGQITYDIQHIYFQSYVPNNLTTISYTVLNKFHCKSSLITFNSFPSILLLGKRTVRVKELPLSIKSLTQGDVYILDCGLKIFVFNAPGANMWEKTKGEIRGEM